jgi:putative spermidine/putrescine transport system substrate-binding protein
MLLKQKIIALCLTVLLVLMANLAFAEEITLNFVTAGDVNMVEYVKNQIGPIFQKDNPGITINVVGTGPGPAGSRKILEKLQAQKDKPEWDVDVAVVHEAGAIWMLTDDLLLKYTDKVENSKLVTSASAKFSLGANVEGYVLPMFQSQTVLAYNASKIPNPPKSYEELVEWAKANPGKFGYNGIKQGMSGISFVTGWLYWKTGQYEILAQKGPYDKKYEESWPKIFEELKEFNKYVTITSGNAGTLDMLNRGEIWMGPVWVDMFYLWQKEGKMPPDVHLVLPSPGMAGQPMFYVIPKNAKNKEAAYKFINFAISPKIQAEYIVKGFTWYPGISPEAVKPHLSEEDWKKLFTDVTPEDLANNSRNFPIQEYFDDMLEMYEEFGG